MLAVVRIERRVCCKRKEGERVGLVANNPIYISFLDILSKGYVLTSASRHNLNGESDFPDCLDCLLDFAVEQCGVQNMEGSFQHIECTSLARLGPLEDTTKLKKWTIVDKDVTYFLLQLSAIIALISTKLASLGLWRTLRRCAFVVML